MKITLDYLRTARDHDLRLMSADELLEARQVIREGP
jgi:hypothetical protein